MIFDEETKLKTEGQRQSWILPMQQEPLAISQVSGTTQSYMAEFERVDLIRRVSSIEKKIEEIDNKFLLSSIVVNTLGSSSWELKQPLNVTVEFRKADDYVACLYDIDLYGYGETIPEALEDLKISMINQFEYLSTHAGSSPLGRLIERQYDFLKSILVPLNV